MRRKKYLRLQTCVQLPELAWRQLVEGEYQRTRPEVSRGPAPRKFSCALDHRLAGRHVVKTNLDWRSSGSAGMVTTMPSAATTPRRCAKGWCGRVAGAGTSLPPLTAAARCCCASSHWRRAAGGRRCRRSSAHSRATRTRSTTSPTQSCARSLPETRVCRNTLGSAGSRLPRQRSTWGGGRACAPAIEHNFLPPARAGAAGRRPFPRRPAREPQAGPPSAPAPAHGNRRRALRWPPAHAPQQQRSAERGGCAGGGCDGRALRAQVPQEFRGAALDRLVAFARNWRAGGGGGAQ